MKTKTLAALFTVAAAVPAAPPLSTLQPGAFRVIPQNLPVNIVFVGYKPGTGDRDVDLSRFLGGLARTHRPRVRTPAIYYGVIKDLGLSFTYEYNPVFASRAFEDAFFAYLNSIAVPRPLNFYQASYNGQTRRNYTISGNCVIDAHAVEKWLGANAPALIGVNTTQYTIFFINWFGRADFRHHAYVAESTDIDSGFNWGAIEENQMIAYGGTAHDDPEDGAGVRHRIWFHDLSAGPDWGTANWDVDDADFDGDGIAEYRIPPVWEYGNLSAYRPFNDLSGDLAKLTRYVALDLLFTPSPLYNPSISGPKLPKNIQVDITAYEGDPSQTFVSRFRPTVLVNSLRALQPMNNFSVQTTGFPLDARVADVWSCYFRQFFGLPSCYGQREPFADLFLYYGDHINQFLEGDADYEELVFIYNGTNAQTPFSGSNADDNWRDGTQSFVYVHTSRFWRQALGYSGVLTHEVGHHLGLSHPHDGYDSESGRNLWPRNRFYFIWTGDLVNSVMSYQQIETRDFGQFDQDNMHRWLTAGYLNEANRVLGMIAASPRAAAVDAAVASADSDAASALAAYAASDYLTAAAKTRSAYDKLLAAAGQIHIQVEPEASPADVRSRGEASKFIDTFDNFERHYPRRGLRR